MLILTSFFEGWTFTSNKQGIRIHHDDGERIPSDHQLGTIAIDDGFVQGVIFYETPVQYQGDVVAACPRRVRQADVALHFEVQIFVLDQFHLLGGQCPVDARDGLAQIAIASRMQKLVAFMMQTESDLRMAQGDPVHDVGDVRQLSLQGTDVFQPGWRVVEKVFDDDRGPFTGFVRPFLSDDAAFYRQVGAALISDSRFDRNFGDGSDTGQSFTPKSQRVDAEKIILRVDFAGRVPRKGKFHLVRRDAVAVVGDLHLF